MQTVAREDCGDVGVLLFVGGTQHRCTLEVAAAHARLQRNGDDEVGLVEVPRQLIAIGHGRNVESAEVVVVPIQLFLTQREGDEPQEPIPFIERSQLGSGAEIVVGDGSECAAALSKPRMIGRPIGRGELKIWRMKNILMVGRRRETGALGHHRRECIRSHERGNDCDARSAELFATLVGECHRQGVVEVVDRIPVGIDEGGRIEHRVPA